MEKKINKSQYMKTLKRCKTHYYSWVRLPALHTFDIIDKNVISVVNLIKQHQNGVVRNES